MERDIWLSACHIPGSTNVDADTESRQINSLTEWSLNLDVFSDLDKLRGPFHIDMFASRLNFKVSSYVSCKPDPGAKYVNAFFMSWKEYYFYAFPPFSVLVACLEKIEQDKATGVLVVPVLQTQPWFTHLLHLLVDNPVLLPQSTHLLTQPHTHVLHPFRKQLRLMACKLSRKASSREIFQARLQLSSSCPGPTESPDSTNQTTNSGWTSVVNGRLIPMIHL